MDNISACSIPSLPVSADDTFSSIPSLPVSQADDTSLVEDESLQQPSLSASRESFEQDSHDENGDANWISRIKQEMLQISLEKSILTSQSEAPDKSQLLREPMELPVFKHDTDADTVDAASQTNPGNTRRVRFDSERRLLLERQDKIEGQKRTERRHKKDSKGGITSYVMKRRDISRGPIQKAEKGCDVLPVKADAEESSYKVLAVSSSLAVSSHGQEAQAMVHLKPVGESSSLDTVSAVCENASAKITELCPEERPPTQKECRPLPINGILRIQSQDKSKYSETLNTLEKELQGIRHLLEDTVSRDG